MSGKWLGDFRSGSRSEYLALYGLSRIASICPVPRQEDFGIRDLVCVLTSERGESIYPESAFYVQVKSNLQPFVFDEDAVQWIAGHMDQPLFICVVDKDDETLRLFSCAPLWLALLSRTDVDRISIRVRLDRDVGSTLEEMRTRGSLQAADQGRGATVDVALGPPVICQRIAELEADPNAAYAVMKTWIQLDAANIARWRMGRIAVTVCPKFEQNAIPPQPYLHVYSYGDETNRSNVENALIPVLTALAHNYRAAKLREPLDAVRQLLSHFDPALFDRHTREFVDGTMTIP